MKKLIFITAIAIITLAFMINSASAEVYLWTDININNDLDTVSQHAYYQFDDTSSLGVGRHKDVPLIIYYVVEPLPYNLTAVGYGGEIDWCNLSFTHTKNEYGTEFVAFQGITAGELINTTVEYSSLYFSGTGNVSSGTVEFDLRDKDSLVANMKCHYTDDQYLYVENVLFGRFDTFLPAFECEGCTEYTLEELSNEIQRNEEITEEQTEIYEKTQEVISRNYELWVIASWLVKIAFLMIAVTLIFLGIYHLYKFFRGIESQI